MPEPSFTLQIADQPPTVLYAEQLRDGRFALGVRRQLPDGAWEPGEMHLLERRAARALAAWLAPTFAEEWAEAVRARQGEQLRTARDLYGEGSEGVRRLAAEVLRELPPGLLLQGLLLLLNAIGPETRERRIAQLNRLPPDPGDAELRRRIADEGEAFGYVLAAAALLDALDRGVANGD